MSRPICIIDDDEDVRAVMSFALEYEGFQTLSLENGQKALEHLSHLSEDEWPCFIIVDYTMPEMNGVEFIKALRKKFPKTLGKIPIALSTARIPSKDEYEMENVILLNKPVSLPDLISTAKEYYQKPTDSHPSI